MVENLSRKLFHILVALGLQKIIIFLFEEIEKYERGFHLSYSTPKKTTNRFDGAYTHEHAMVVLKSTCWKDTIFLKTPPISVHFCCCWFHVLTFASALVAATGLGLVSKATNMLQEKPSNWHFLKIPYTTIYFHTFPYICLSKIFEKLYFLEIVPKDWE